MTFKAIRMRARALFDRAGAEAELDDEVRFHLEQQTQLYVSRGLTPDEARRRALVDFGGVDSTKESYRDGRGTRSVDDVMADLRYALRALWRDRALAVAGVLTLALGIGATTAVFSAVNAVMLRELPFRDASRLVAVWEENPDRGWYKNVVAPANFIDWRDRVQAFESAAGYTDYLTNVTLLGHGEPQLLAASNVTSSFVDVLGVRLALGHGFQRGADWEDGPRGAIISYRVWKNHFRGDSGVIGTSMSFGGRLPWQIIGVMPEGFALPTPNTDVWFPMQWARNSPSQIWFRRAHWMRVVARLQPGVSIESANASLQTVVTRLQAEYPQTNTRMGAGMTPMRDWIVGDTKRPLVVLLSAAAVLLLIACANVGNLLLVHALGRSRDTALRYALGATRRRVARQALTESLLLSLVGGVAGLALGAVGARVLLALQPTGMLPVADVAIDYRVLLFAVLLVTVSGLLFGMAPALNATRQSPAEALNSGGRAFTSSRVRRWGKHLVVAEVALAVLLAVGAGLLLRSYDRLAHVPPGFDGNGVLTAQLSVPGSRYDSATKVIAFYSTLIERLGALPGVERVAATRELPVTVTSWSANLAVSGRPPMEQSADILYREIMGDYLRVMRVPLIRGRAFDDAVDRRDAPPVALVNEALVKQYFPNEDPVGQRISTDRVPDSTSTWRTIVGVVGSEHQGSLALPARPEVLLPMPQNATSRMNVVMRVKDGRDPMSFAGSLKQTVRGMDSLLAISRLESMPGIHSAAMSRERFTSVLVLSFALSGIALALVGVFGVLAQLVQTREREMGIRMALGAQRSQVSLLVVRHGATLLGVGVVIGLVAALATTRVLSSLLYGVRATDALTYAAVALLISGVGLAAAWIPARRASTADPAMTLRSE